MTFLSEKENSKAHQTVHQKRAIHLKSVGSFVLNNLKGYHPTVTPTRAKGGDVLNIYLSLAKENFLHDVQAYIVWSFHRKTTCSVLDTEKCVRVCILEKNLDDFPKNPKKESFVDFLEHHHTEHAVNRGTDHILVQNVVPEISNVSKSETDSISEPTSISVYSKEFQTELAVYLKGKKFVNIIHSKNGYAVNFKKPEDAQQAFEFISLGNVYNAEPSPRGGKQSFIVKSKNEKDVASDVAKVAETLSKRVEVKGENSETVPEMTILENSFEKFLNAQEEFISFVTKLKTENEVLTAQLRGANRACDQLRADLENAKAQVGFTKERLMQVIAETYNALCAEGGVIRIHKMSPDDTDTSKPMTLDFLLSTFVDKLLVK